MERTPLTFGSLFAGIGGFDLGFERAGMVCRWQVEIDDYANRVLAKHWPHVQRWGDVRTFPVGSPDEWRVDVISAGVPCQPVSHAGKQKGADDERWMWGEALRVVADLKPRFFVAENPIGILNHDGGRTFRGFLRALASVGYVCEWHVIAAADVGAPHQRDRVWLVAHSDATGVDSLPLLRKLPLYDSRHARSRLRLPANRGVAGRPIQAQDDVADSDGQGLQGAVLEHAGEGLSRPRGRAWRDEEQDLPEAARGWWAVEPDVGRVAHGVSARVDRLRCLGNSVVPQITEVIGRAILEFNAV